MRKNSFLCLLVVGLCFGCSESSFDSSTGKSVNNDSDNQIPTEQPATDPVEEPADAEPLPEEPPPPVKGEPACSTTESIEIDASVPAHKDSFHDPALPDILETNVITLPLASISGSQLPVENFGLDDVAILVKESVSIASIYSRTSAERTISLPSDAYFLFDGNLADFASGRVDSYGTTIYNFNGKSVNLPGHESRSLKEVYDLGVPLIAHNKVEIADLITNGYKVGDDLKFKLLHVAHGSGFLSLKFTIPKCE